jgi:hypothetical protein
VVKHVTFSMLDQSKFLLSKLPPCGELYVFTFELARYFSCISAKIPLLSLMDFSFISTEIYSLCCMPDTILFQRKFCLLFITVDRFFTI